MVQETMLTWHYSWELATITGHYFCIQADSLILSLTIIPFLLEKALVAEYRVGVMGCKKKNHWRLLLK